MILHKTYQTSYECFRPSKMERHLGRWYYRGGWHQSFPALIRLAFYTRQKFLKKEKHSRLLSHACAHWKSSAPAAPRRARTSVSESFWGLPLSRPLPVLGLLSNYLNNYLIGRSPILKRRSFEWYLIPENIIYLVLSSVSRGYSRLKGKLTTCYSAVCPVLRQ